MNKKVKEFLDKSSNYEVIEYIENLQQENQQLQKELECTIGIVEHNRIISKKNKEIHQLKEDIKNIIKILEKNCDDLEATEEEFDSLDKWQGLQTVKLIKADLAEKVESDE